MKLNTSFGTNKNLSSSSRGLYSGVSTSAGDSRIKQKRLQSAFGRPSYNTVEVDSPKINNYTMMQDRMNQEKSINYNTNVHNHNNKTIEHK